MLYYRRINVTQGIDSKKTNNLPKYIVCRYNYFSNNFLTICM